MMRVLVPKERGPGEARVAATPETVKRMVALGLEVMVEAGAGALSHIDDQRYESAGARVDSDVAALWKEAGLVVKVGPLEENADLGGREEDFLEQGSVVIGLLDPFARSETVRTLARRGVTSLPMELIPRVTLAQSMDALSSQASIAGYKAVLLAASRLGRYFPLLMTAAGTVPPAKVVVIGAGVAGLQAVATAKRLGAVVEVSDIRPAVQEQVESLGGRFIELPMAESGEGEGGYAREMGEDFLRRQGEILAEHVAGADVVIATAQVPGKRAPRIVTAQMVEAMRSGSVIVDLAAPAGGNCELSRPGEELTHRGVQILGPTNLPATMPVDASTLYARNVLALLQHLLDEGALKFDREDEIVAGTLLTHEGEIVHPLLAQAHEEVETS